MIFELLRRRKARKAVAKRLAAMTFEFKVKERLRETFPEDSEAFFLAHTAAVKAFKEMQA